MSIWITFFGVLAVAIAGIACPAVAQPISGNLSNWGIVCFCLHSVSTPQHVIKQGDNGRLLYLARNGATVAELKRKGVAASDEQLRILQYWSLLTRRGDTYFTNFPVLSPKEMAALRLRVDRLAATLLPKIAPQVRRLNSELAREGFEKSQYAILFSYVLDGLVWEKLEQSRTLPSSVPTPSHPQWNGALWAFAPVRAGAEGTNEDDAGRVALMSLWNDRVVDRLRQLVAAGRLTDELIDNDHGRIAKASLLTDSKGQLRVPFIRNSQSDPARREGSQIASNVVRYLDGSSGRRLINAIPGANKDVGLLVVTHELMWDLIDQMTRKGLVERPPVLTGAVAATPEALLPLLYVVEKPAP